MRARADFWASLGIRAFRLLGVTQLPSVIVPPNDDRRALRRLFSSSARLGVTLLKLKSKVSYRLGMVSLKLLITSFWVGTSLESFLYLPLPLKDVREAPRRLFSSAAMLGVTLLKLKSNS